MTRLSVVIPTYNRADSVCEAIDSVLAQSPKADEVIVVDDGSTDDTAERLDKYRDDIILIRQPNQGVSAARNAGVAAAKGDWIAFLDSDDIWLPNRLAVLDRDIGQTEAGLHIAGLSLGPTYGEVIRFVPDGFPRERATLVADGLEIALLGGPLIPATAMRRDWICAVGGLDVSLSYGEDTLLLCRLSLLGPLLVTSEIVACARQIEGDEVSLNAQGHSSALPPARLWVKIHDLVQAERRGGAQLEAVALHTSGLLFMLAHEQAKGGKIADSWRTLLESARRHPSLKGWVKIVPPILFGRRGYEAVLHQGRTRHSELEHAKNRAAERNVER